MKIEREHRQEDRDVKQGFFLNKYLQKKKKNCKYCNNISKRIMIQVLRNKGSTPYLS